jgi:CHRD domain
MRLRWLVLLMLVPIVTPQLAMAAPIAFSANLDGPSEEPPNASPGTGFALVTIDPVAHTMDVSAVFADLIGTTTAAHIHVINGPGDANTSDTVGPVATTVPVFPGFPLGVTSGTYDQLFDMTDAGSYRPGFVTDSGSIAAAELALFDAIVTGRAYFNIHSTFAPGGEIRGFLAPVPEPASAGLVLLALVGLAVARSRLRRPELR